MYSYIVDFVAFTGRRVVDGKIASITSVEDEDRVINSIGEHLLKMLSPGGELYQPHVQSSWFVINNIKRIC